MRSLVLLLAAFLVGCDGPRDGHRQGNGKAGDETGQNPKAKHPRDKKEIYHPWSVEVTRAALSPDAKSVLICYEASHGRKSHAYLKLWEAATGRELHTLSALAGRDSFIFAAFLADGKTALAASGTGTLRWYAIPGGRLLRSVQAHQGRCNDVAVSRDGRRALTTGSNDGGGDLKLWDLKTGQLVRAFGQQRPNPCPALSPDGKQVLSVSVKFNGINYGVEAIKLWDVATGKVLRLLQGSRGWAGPVAFTPNGKQALSGRISNRGKDKKEGRLVLWDVASGETVSALDNEYEGGVVDYKLCATHLIALTVKPTVGSQDYTVKFWDLASGKVVRSLPLNPGQKEGKNDNLVSKRVRVFAVTPDGKRALSIAGVNREKWGQHDITVRVWDLVKGKLLHDWQDPTACP
jgi:WD40 repeat protein